MAYGIGALPWRKTHDRESGCRPQAVSE
jgi:hypothetical protein